MTLSNKFNVINILAMHKLEALRSLKLPIADMPSIFSKSQ